MLGHAAGGTAAGFVIFSVATVLGGFDDPFASSSAIMTGIGTLWLIHWLILRRHLICAHWLAFGAVAGLFGAIVGGGLIGAWVGGISAGGGFGAGYGSVTGITVAMVMDRSGES